MHSSPDFADSFWQKNYLLTDSRKLVYPADTLFFALPGQKSDGHLYVEELYEKGVRHFVVADGFAPAPEYGQARFYHCPSPLRALQQLCAWHREKFSYPVVAITGSNAKTIIKEWLYQLLEPDEAVVKSPKSYNSQTGVPLSVWQMRPHHQRAIFEAGISRTGEMQYLQQILKPDIGIFTNIGPAHDEGFSSRQQKIDEKMRLFAQVKTLIFCADHPQIVQACQGQPFGQVTWSQQGRPATVQFALADRQHGQQQVVTRYRQHEFLLDLPFTDPASLENAFHCVTCLLLFGYSPATIAARVRQLQNLPLRLEWKTGKNNCVLAVDAYNNDLAGLVVALDFLAQQDDTRPRTLLLSDMLETGSPPDQLYRRVASLARQKGIQRFIGIGPELQQQRQAFYHFNCSFFTDTASFLQALPGGEHFSGEAILLKGARRFGFEQIADRLQEKIHGTRLEISLEALAHNLAFYKGLLGAGTRIMVMVKAFAYGSGSQEVARLLQYHQVDYLAVAYTDEGVRLRENGIRLPVMVMNPARESFGQLLAHCLEPEIYSPGLLQAFGEFVARQQLPTPFPVHIAFDTGMRRLGFAAEDLPGLLRLLRAYPCLKVATAFSHLAAADDPAHEEFTRQQIERFRTFSGELRQAVGYPFMRHLLNSAGITRYPEASFDMVRLGIGLYGVEVNNRYQQHLRTVGTLKTTISQIKQLKKGETVGYGRAAVVSKDSTIATIAIGYADGFGRRFGQGRGKVLVNGQLAPVTGNVCMDMAMIDITGITASEGDEVVVFGEQPTAAELASWGGTIPYEIISQVNERVKRVFFE